MKGAKLRKMLGDGISKTFTFQTKAQRFEVRRADHTDESQAVVLVDFTFSDGAVTVKFATPPRRDQFILVGI